MNCKLYTSLLVGLLLHYIGIAQPTRPILRINSDMHSGVGTKIAADAAGKYLLTSSNDKTAMLWNAATGALLRTFRIPIDSTDEGKLFSCALSPDGKVAALGGWTGAEWDKSFSVYLLNTQTGEMIDRIRNLPELILDLEFSPDGQWLAAGIGGANGVWVIDAKSWGKHKPLTGYGGPVYNVAFNRDNKLATTCFDGKIRLYNSSFELIKEVESKGGKKIRSVTFNPSGTLLAIGYVDAAIVDVRNTSDLSLAYKANITSAAQEKGDLDILSFSNNGAMLYGGGTFVKLENGAWKQVLRVWNDAAKGSYTDILLMANSIMDIKPLPNGNMAVIGAYPDMAVVSPSGTAWYHKAATLDFAARDKSHLRCNITGVAIGFTPFNQQPLSFDIESRSLSTQAALYPIPANSNAGIVVANWQNSETPEINGNKVTLSQYERCLSTDVTGDGKKAVLGANWNLYLYDGKGTKLWKTPLPTNAFAVNIAGNDKVVVAALGDGTIRWYGMADGKELLAFYLHSDRKRWVLFTPQGYYDASAGAEEFLGWHINNGPDKTPSFHLISRFRDKYHRTDIIDAIFETYDEEAAISLANSRSTKKPSVERDITQELPPTITITSPASGSTVTGNSIAISYSVNTPAGTTVKNIKVLVNGRPVAVERGLDIIPAKNNVVKVTIPEGSNTVTLLAENENGISPEADLYLTYRAPPQHAEDVARKYKLYVLAIGISDYDNPDYELNYAADDAQSFVSALQQQKGGLYEDVVVKKLIDKEAKRENIQDGLQWIQEQTGQKDIAMIFFSGHGANDNNGIFYMLPAGADVSRMRSTCLNFEELKQTVSNIAGKVVVFVDACHSGNVMGNNGTRGPADINAMVNELSSTPNGAVTITSSTGREYSLENPAWKHGAFTLAILEGMGGKANPTGKKITVKNLDYYISERVKELTNGKQHPTSVIPPNVPDFQIGIVN